MKILAVEAKMESIVQALDEMNMLTPCPKLAAALKDAREVLAEIKREHERWRAAVKKRNALRDDYCRI